MHGMMKCGCAMMVFASVAHADIYRMTLSGTLDEVEDNRMSTFDPFEGTALDMDVYTASAGDVWSYEVIFDTDVTTDINPGQNAIYGPSFASSITIAGRRLDMFYDSLLYYYADSFGDIDVQQMEIWGYANESATVGVYSSFLDFDNVDTLINGGEVVDNAEMFESFDISGFGIFGDDDSVRWVAGQGPYSVTVEQIPAPGALAVLGIGGLMSVRRRR